MGTLFLLISAVLDGIKGCLSKPVSRHTATLSDSLLINASRTVLCAVFGFVFCLITLGRMPDGRGGTAVIALLSGASTALFMVSWLMAMRTGAFMTLTVLGTASCIVPILLSALFFGEALSLRHLLGAGLLVLASALLCTYQKKTKGRFAPGEALWIALMFISCSLVNFSQKIFTHTAVGCDTADYNFFTYLVAAVLLTVILPFCRQKGLDTPPAVLLKKTGVLVLLLALSLYFVDYFRTLAAQTVPAGILYPTSSAIVLLINQAYSFLFLKEKPDAGGWTGLVLTLAAIIIINL